MKYTQYSQKKKGNSAFYITIAMCLVLIGVAAWFAFANVDNNQIEKVESNNTPSSTPDEYNSNNESYIESEPPVVSEESVSSETTSGKAQKQEYTPAKETAKKKAYALPVNGDILKDFNLKTLQYSATYNDMRIHAAVDIACNEGTIVSAVTDGKIQDIETTADYGKVVTIDHGDGLVIKYCGLKNITAEKDTAVKMGDNIGAVGTIPSECSDHSHLHIETYENGNAVSILKFFQ